MPHRNPRDREAVQNWAKSLFELKNFYIVDTETTGTGNRDEVLQIGIVDKHGEVVLDTLVRPTVRVPYSVTQIHGITNEMLVDAPTFSDVYTDLSIKLAGSVLIAYNIDFDWRLLKQSADAHKLPMFRVKEKQCAMKTYAKYHGAWNPSQGDYKWQRLGNAALIEDIEVIDAHSALGDVRMTLALLERMAGLR